MSTKKYQSYSSKNNKANTNTKPVTLIPPAPNYPSPTDHPDDKQEAFNFLFPSEEQTPPYESFLPPPEVYEAPYPKPKENKEEPKKSNFIKIDEKGFYYRLEHRITKERKWIHKKYFNTEKLAEVFYDQDPKFTPVFNGGAKW